MTSVPYGLAQGLQSATVTRGLAAWPERFEGRSRYSSLSPSGRPSGMSAADEGPTANILKGPIQFSESFSFSTLLSARFPNPLADSGGGIVDPYPSASRVFGAAAEGIGESGIATVYPSNGEGVLFSHKFVGALLTLACEVAIGELIAVEVLMGTTVRSIKDGEGKALEASDVDFIGGKARRGANGVVMGVFDVGKMDVPVVLVFVTDHG